MFAFVIPSSLWAGEITPTTPLIVIEGPLHYADIEGGVWTIRTADGKVYDLHGDIPLKDGDRVRMKGIAPKGMTCIHMVGTIFIPTSIEKIASVPAAPDSPPTAAPATWKLVKDTFTCYGADGAILWQENKVQYFTASKDGSICILVRHLDPKGGKKRRDYAAVYRDGKPVYEFYEAPVPVTYRKEEPPIFINPSGRFGWVQDNIQTIFFDARTNKQKSFRGEGFAQINDAGEYKIYGMKLGGTFTMLRQEGKFE